MPVSVRVHASMSVCVVVRLRVFGSRLCKYHKYANNECKAQRPKHERKIRTQRKKDQKTSEVRNERQNVVQKCGRCAFGERSNSKDAESTAKINKGQSQGRQSRFKGLIVGLLNRRLNGKRAVCG